MQSTHLLHLSAAALQRNHHHATHLFDCSYIQPFDRQMVPDFRKCFSSHWFIQPEPAWLSNLPEIIVKRTITALCVPATASVDSPEDLIHILFWVPDLFPRLRRYPPSCGQRLRETN
ncbi:hypothetical protein AMECASPLE_036242 [Ameca splendens]|uniref:Uncharacterized protein n=1 Tax=Ameca splendens TaxID=208324 RepID=A0ABV0YUN0_9TELE